MEKDGSGGWEAREIWKFELCLFEIQSLHYVYNRNWYIYDKLIFMRFQTLKKDHAYILKVPSSPKIDRCSNYFGIIGTKERSLNNYLIWKKALKKRGGQFICF